MAMLWNDADNDGDSKDNGDVNDGDCKDNGDDDHFEGS